MKSSTAGSHSLKASLSRIFGVLIPIVIALFLVSQQANFLVGRSLLIAFGDTESTYKSAWLEWDGDVVAKELVIYPYELGEEAAIRFAQVHVETPGWFWFLRNTFDRKLRRAKLDRIHLTLTGGVSEAGFEPSLGDLGPFGAASASPFEAEGCMQDGMWMRDELQQMGLHPEPTRLEFDYRVEGNQLLTTVVLETQGSSRVQLDRKSELPTRINALLLDQVPSLTQSERWQVQDMGFVSARNRYCAKKDGIDARRFIERHVETVDRLLETLGFAVDADTRLAYRRFARDGGTLVFDGVYAQPLHSDEFYDLRDSGEAMTRMNARIAHNDRATAVQWQRFDPRALPGLDEGEPTFALLQKERASATRGETAAVAVAPAAAATAAPDTATATTTPATTSRTVATDPPATPPPLVPVAAPVAAAIPPPIAPVAAPVAAAVPPPIPPVATPVSAAAIPADPPTEPVAAVATPSPVAPANAMPVPIPAPTRGPAFSASGHRITASSLPAAKTGPIAGTPLTWSELPNYRGRVIRVWTVHNEPSTVNLLEADAAAIRVKARLGGGHAEYTIQREGFLRASLIQ